MPSNNLRQALIFAPLILVLISTGTFAQDSSPGTPSRPAASASTAGTQSPQASTTGAITQGQASTTPGQKTRQLTADEWQRRFEKEDPELAAVAKAESEERYVDAEELLHAAIKKAEESPVSKKRVRMLLDRLVGVEFRLGRGEEAFALRERILDMDKEIYGPEHAIVVQDLINLAMSNRSDAQRAEEYFAKALALARENTGPKSSALLIALEGRSEYLLSHDRSAEAEPLIEEALQSCQPGQSRVSCDSFRHLQAQALSKGGELSAAERISEAAVATNASSGRPWQEQVRNLEQLAQQYEQDGALNDAERNYRQAMALIEANDEFSLPYVLNSLGQLLMKEARNDEAEGLFKRALELEEKWATSGKPFAGRFLTPYYLEELYRSEGRLADMEPIFKQVLAFDEQKEGQDSATAGWLLSGMVRVYSQEGKYADAEAPCDRALKILEAHYGPDSGMLQSILWPCSDVARHLGKTDKADALMSRSQAIRAKSLAKQSN